jgi:hypothetical protein
LVLFLSAVWHAIVPSKGAHLTIQVLLDKLQRIPAETRITLKIPSLSTNISYPFNISMNLKKGYFEGKYLKGIAWIMFVCLKAMNFICSCSFLGRSGGMPSPNSQEQEQGSG